MNMDIERLYWYDGNWERNTEVLGEILTFWTKIQQQSPLCLCSYVKMTWYVDTIYSALYCWRPKESIWGTNEQWFMACSLSNYLPFESAIAQVLPCCGRDDAQQWLLHPQYLPPPTVIITRSYPTWVRRLVSLPTRTPPSVSSHEISRNLQNKTLQTEVTMDGLRGEEGFYGSLSHNCTSTVWRNTLQNLKRDNGISAFYLTFFQGFKTLFEDGPVCLSRQPIRNFICIIFLE